MPKRQMTREELEKFLNLPENFEKIKGPGERTYVYKKDVPLAHLKDIASKYGISTERDATPASSPFLKEKEERLRKEELRKENIARQRQIDAEVARAEERESDRLSSFIRTGKLPANSPSYSPYSSSPLNFEDYALNEGIKSPIASHANSPAGQRMLANVQNLIANPHPLTRTLHKAVNSPIDHRSVISTKRENIASDHHHFTPIPNPEIPQEFLGRNTPYTPPPIPEETQDEDAERVTHTVTMPDLPAFGGASDTAFGPYEDRAFKHLLKKELLHNYNKGPGPRYKGQADAPLSSRQKRARKYTDINDPYISKRIRAQNERLEKGIEYGLSLPKTSTAAEPYLKEASKNPVELYEQLMGQDSRDYLNSFLEEYDKDFAERVLPLMNKHIVPGQRGQSGMQNRLKAELLEKHKRDRELIKNEIKMKNKLATLNVGENYASRQGKSAELASHNASQDKGNELAGTSALSIAYGNEQKAKKEQAREIERLGAIEQQLQTTQNMRAMHQYEKEKEYGPSQLNQLLNAAQGHALQNDVYKTHVQGASNPGATGPNVYDTTGAATMALAANLLPQQQQTQRSKKGGLIKAIKRADGGSIMKEAVQNSVIDQADPLDELRRLMNRQRMVDVYETSIGKRRYRNGGMISPIQQGAMEAKQLMGEKELREQTRNMMHPIQKPMMTGALDAFMKGAAATHSGEGNFLSRGALGYTSAANDRDAQADKERERILNAYKLQYDLDREAKKEASALRKEEREERKLDLLLQKINAKGSEKKEKSQKLDKEDHELLSEANKTLKNAPIYKKQLNRLKDLNKNITTGTFSQRGTVGRITDQGMQENLGHGSKAEREEYNKITGNFALNATRDFGRLGGARIADMWEKVKPSEEVENEANRSNINMMNDELDYKVALSQYIKEKYKEGISPQEALSMFTYEFPTKEQIDEADLLAGHKIPGMKLIKEQAPTGNIKLDLLYKAEALAK